MVIRPEYPPAQTRSHLITDYNHAPQQQIPVSDRDPIAGPKKSPVEIVVFTDFQCRSCQYFSDMERSILAAYQGQVHLVLKDFPLSKSCNAFVEGNDVHPRACDAALAVRLGLDSVRFEQDRHSAAAYARLSDDLAEGHRLHIQGTPAVFLNGKQVKDFWLQPLSILIESVLKK